MEGSKRGIVLCSALAIVISACATDTTSEPPPGEREYGPGSEWIDEPLPDLEELVDASSCEDFMRMLIGVDNERFRLKANVTAADDLQNNYTHWDFDDYDVFADLQFDIGCGDGEFFTRVDNAFLARCDRWFGEGHSPNENPLMLNTEQCLN